MREILFRGKRMDNGEWAEGYLYEHEPALVGISSENDAPKQSKWFIAKTGFADWNMPRPVEFVEIDPSTVGQYTGLTDKNDKKIFEGDIMAFTAYGFDYVGTVEFADGSFSVMCEHTSPFLDQAVSKHGAYIIGNMHDNPQLLKGAE